MTRVAFLTRDWSGEEPNLVPGGCNFYRCYLPALMCGQKAAVGLPVYDPIRGYGAKENAQTGLFGYNIIVLKLIMDRTTAPQMRLAKQNARQKFIVDIDDFYHGLTPANKAFALSHPDNNKKSNRDFYENVIHFVLARREGGGPGTKGLSLFLIPKFMFDLKTGDLGKRNGVYVTALEDKMGLNVSATCEVYLGENEPAVGYLLGDVHKGIAQMFKIIEFARMMVGTKAIATLSAGYQQALSYAKTRVQGGDMKVMKKKKKK